MQNNISDILDKIIIYLIKGLVFTLPLFFLPWTTEWFEFNKQYLLWLIVPLIIILWLIKMTFDKKIEFKRTPLDMPILIFLAITSFSSILSLDKFSSFFGFYGRFSDAWLGAMSLALFYFVLTNFSAAKNKLNVFVLVKLILFSYSVVVVVAFLAIFGWLGKFVKSINVFFSPTFNPAGGSLESLSIFSVAMSLLLISLLVFNNKRSYNKLNKFQFWYFSAILVLSILFLAIINFSIAWWCLLIGAVLHLVITFSLGAKQDISTAMKINKGEKLRSLIWPVILIMLALIFLIFPSIDFIRVTTGQELPSEVRLDYINALSITKQSIESRALLGSGPGTFSYDFSLYRSPEFNQSRFWQFRFDKSPSHILEMAATLGILGMLAYFLIFSLFFYLVFIFIKRSLLLKSRDNVLLISLLIVFIILFLAQFIYLTNTSLLFLFWTILALVMVLLRELDDLVFKKIKLRLNKSEKSLRLIYMLLLVVVACWLALTTLEIKYWIADIVYAKNFSKEADLIKAIQLNPNRYNYQISLAKLYLNKAQAEFAKPSGKRNNQLIHINIDNSIKWARTATQTAVNSVVSWETLAMIYRDVRLFTRGSETWAERSFKQASELEPTNPVLLTELGKAYMNKNMFKEAVQSFEQALELKDDYYEAKFNLAKVYVNYNKPKKALAILDELVESIKNPEIYFERGRLYYNQGEINQAISNFLKVLDISPNHSNALYSLGLAYQLQGDKDKALIYFKKVLQLNPDNEEVMRNIEALEG